MKKLLLIMAAALVTMTQCRKQETVPVTPADGTVKMTITAGPGRTDINTATGAITWSAGDKLYVSDGTEWLGSLTLVGEGGSAQGTFTGDIAGLDESETPCHFFYLGHDNSMTEPTGSTAASISFAAQDGTLAGAMKYHLGYGNTNVTVTDGEAIGSVIMNTKIAIAHLNLITAGPQAYTGSVTMEGTGICNVMTVNPNGTFSGSGTDGITIGATTTGEKYVTLIPTTGTDRVDVAFTDDAIGSMIFLAGIQANKFYGMSNAMEVTVKPVAFSVGMDGDTPRTVKFSPGNLQYLGKLASTGTWRFAEHQWDYMGDGPNTTTGYKGNVDLSSLGYSKYNTGSGSEAARDLFGWGCTGYQDERKESHTNWYQTNYQPYSTSTSSVSGGSGINDYGYGPDYYSGSKYNLTVENKSDWGCLTIGSDPAGTWRTLSSAEWAYLFNERTVNGGKGEGKSWRRATINSDASDGSKVYGMLLYPDGYTAQTTAASYTTEQWSAMESAGVVFLPAAGRRSGTSLDNVGSYGLYWSSSCSSSILAYSMYFYSGYVYPQRSNGRYYGFSVRLVR